MSYELRMARAGTNGGEAKRFAASERRVSRWLLPCGCLPHEVKPGHDVRACREQLDRDVDRILGRHA